MKRNRLLLGLAAFTGLAVSSCQPYSNAGGGIQITLEQSKAILVDAGSVSCTSAHSVSPTTDLAALSTGLGRVKVVWSVPESMRSSTTVTLKLIYLAIKLRSSGLAQIDVPRMIAGQELNCIVSDNPDGASSLSLAQGAIQNGQATPYEFPFELRLGGLASRDTKKETSFGGSASMLIYGLVHDPPAQDIPIIGRASFQFSFGGIML